MLTGIITKKFDQVMPAKEGRSPIHKTFIKVSDLNKPGESHAIEFLGSKRILVKNLEVNDRVKVSYKSQAHVANGKVYNNKIGEDISRL